MSDFDTYLDTAVKIAKYAGGVIKKNATMDVVADWKGDGTPVTKTDIEINEYVINTIKKSFPSHDVLGEEGSSVPTDSDYCWVCDPIDGTIPFSHGLQISTFSIALVKNGKPILGVILDPFQDLLFTSILGGGAFRNGEKLHVNSAKTLKDKIVSFDAPEWGGGIFHRLVDVSAFPCVYQSYIFGAKQVASGHFIGSYFGWNKPFDCAAIKILVEEAGGKTSDYDGNDQRYDRKLNGFIASNGHVHEELLNLINEARNEFYKTGKKSRFEFML